MKNLLALVLFITPFYAFNQELAVTDQTGIESEISIAVNPNNADEIIIASMGTNSPIIIYTSTNGGDTWSQTSFGDGVADPVLTYGDNNTAYLTFLDFGNTLEMYLAKSTDNGLNWEVQMLPLDGMAADRQWIKRDNAADSPYYGNVYLSYFHPEGVRDIHIVKVDDAGNIGQNHPVHSTAYNTVQNPAMDVALSGAIVICFLAQDNNGDFKIIAVHSTNGGTTFSTETTVANLNLYNSNGDPIIDVVGFAPGASSRLGNSLQMAIDRSAGPHAGRVYLSWTDFIAGNPQEGMNVYLSYSDNNGQTWSFPKVVNDDNIPSTHQYYAAIDVNPMGIVCLSWYDRRVDPVNDALTDFYFAYSADGGSNFEPAVKVNSVSSDHNAVTSGLTTFGVGEYTSLATTENHAYLVWSDGRENDGDMDVYFAKVNLDNVNDREEVKLQPALVIEGLFPNPIVEEKAMLKINATRTGEIEITITNLNGQIISQTKRSINSVGVNLHNIDLSNYPPGSYFVKIQHLDGMATKKIIIGE